MFLCAQAANKTLKAMLDNDHGQAAEVELELGEMRGFLLDEQEIAAARFLAVLQARPKPFFLSVNSWARLGSMQCMVPSAPNPGRSGSAARPGPSVCSRALKGQP